jgi:hypothetical protein
LVARENPAAKYEPEIRSSLDARHVVGREPADVIEH